MTLGQQLNLQLRQYFEQLFKAESQATNEEDEEQKLEMKDTYFRRQGSCVMHPATNQKSGSFATTSNNDVDSASHDSRQRLSTNTEGASLITSAKMQGDVGSSMQIGLNIFEEITVKYNKELKQQLKKSILTSKSSMSFEDIAGNEYAKEIINETFILPTIMPKVFKGKARPWQSILLYGPPGVGKTMLAQAVCYHSKATCFWVSLADITSKFIGESEKLLQMLFELAREHSPSILLIDEMDSLGRKRTGKESETERRIKTEFLKQMDNIKNIPESVSVFATTNMPWELDIAALRRFERKILVPMPDKETRKKIIRLHAGTHHTLSEQDIEILSSNTEGYSGSDLSTLVNDALMRPIKQVQQATHFKRVEKRELIDQLKGEYNDYFVDEEEKAVSASQDSISGGRKKRVAFEQSEYEEEEEDLTGSVWMPVITETKQQLDELVLRDPNVKEMDLPAISTKEIFVRKANLADFKKSIDNCKPTVHISFLELYGKFLEKYGHSDQSEYVNEIKKLQPLPQHLSYYA